MTIEEKIKKLLEWKPQLRNSDKELLLEIFRIKGVGLTHKQEKKITSFITDINIIINENKNTVKANKCK